MPPRARKAAQAAPEPEQAPSWASDLMDRIEDQSGRVETVILRLQALADPPRGEYDAEGYVVGHIVVVEQLLEGDVIAVGAAGTDLMPMVYRYHRDGLRNEYGITHPIGHIPKPWRLLWRNPRHALEAAKKGKDDDA